MWPLPPFGLMSGGASWKLAEELNFVGVLGVEKSLVVTTVEKTLTGGLSLGESYGRIISGIPTVHDDLSLGGALSVVKIGVVTTVAKTLYGSVVLGESRARSIESTAQALSNVTASAFGAGATVAFDTGPLCESVRIERSVNYGGWVFHQDMDTLPNSAGYTSGTYYGTAGQVVSFRVTPYPANLQGGTPGTAVTSNEVTLSEDL